MTNLYVASWAPGGGKTTLCVGIGRHLQNKGKRVGYLKPVLLPSAGTSPGMDKDAQFIHQVLELDEPVERLCPLRWVELREEDFPHKLRQAHSVVAKDKDIVLLEGWGELRGTEVLQLSSQIVDIVDAKVIIVVPYSTDLPWEKITFSIRKFAPRLLGIVVTKTPKARMESVRARMISLFGKDGVRILGVLPEERLLLTVSVAELAEYLQAEVLCCPEASSELVENLMIGVLGVDPGADYFARKANKAVITGGERPDIQLAALATSTKCLILSDGKAPIPQVLHWAEDKGTSILSVKQDIPSIVASIEGLFLQTRFQQSKKLEKLAQILEQHFDFNTLYQSFVA